MIDFTPPPKLWLPPKPAIERAASLDALRRAKQATFPFPVFCPAASYDIFTKLIAHFEAADASTSIIDSSAQGHTLTPAGNAQIDTAQFKFGTSSLLLDGTGDYVDADGSADMAFGSGDFTIDLWLRLNALSSQAIYDSRPTSTDTTHLLIYFHSSNQFRFYMGNIGDLIARGTGSTGVWTQIAVARSGTSTKMFQDGTQIGSTYTDSNSYLNGTSRPRIGASGFDATSGFNGWIDELRVSKGIARWTSNFTPPTAPYV